MAVLFSVRSEFTHGDSSSLLLPHPSFSSTKEQFKLSTRSMGNKCDVAMFQDKCAHLSRDFGDLGEEFSVLVSGATQIQTFSEKFRLGKLKMQRSRVIRLFGSAANIQVVKRGQ
jgi:predicted chitinase